MIGAAPVLSIVTVFWNGRAMALAYAAAMRRAIDALDFPVQTIVVDNASTDGTPEALATEAPWIELIRNDRNTGFAPACNQGMARARGAFLLLLNPDCEANARALSALVEFLRKHPTVGAVGCRLLHEDGLPQNSHHREPSALSYWATHSLLSPAILRVAKVLHRVAPAGSRRPMRVDWLMGACLMMSRAAYERVGGLDPDYFMYSEDADWCRRAREHGFAIVHDPRPSMLHRHGTSARRRKEFTFRRLYRSLLMYTRKHHRGLAGVALRATVMADLAVRMPIYLLQGDGARVASVKRLLAMYARNDPDMYPDDAPEGVRS